MGACRAIEDAGTKKQPRVPPPKQVRWYRLGTARIPGIAVAAVVVLAVAAGHAAAEQLRSLGHPPAVPIEQVADVILVLKPHETYSLHVPATIDRVIQGDLMRLEKGVMPTMIVHTRNSFGSPLEAGVPVKLFLMRFRDGHGHYIIGVGPESFGGRP